MANEIERYLDVHPFRPWDRNAWDERSAIIDTAFHNTDIWFTPLIGNSMTMPVGVGWDDYWWTGSEIVQAHVNHEPIGRYQRMMGPIYIDTRQKRVRSRYRYAAKWQMDEMDEMITRWGNDTPQFITRVLDAQLADQIVGIQEKLARAALFDFVLFDYLNDGTAFVADTNDLSDLTTTAASAFDLRVLEDVALRMSYRVEDTLHQWGNYAQPVPGQNFRSSVLVLTTTGTFWELWNSDAQEWMVDLRQLQDGRIINNAGGAVQYRNVTLVDTGHALILWNAGTISKQVAVTSPINWGDGAYDPDSGAVDNVWYTGQSPASVTHYLQCSAFAATEFTAGDFVSVHTAQTGSAYTRNYGILGGCDPFHGKTVRVEIENVDAGNNRLRVRKPMTEEYVTPFTYTNLDGAAAVGEAYAMVTSAQHIHPVVIVGAREMIQWVARKQATGETIKYNRPDDTVADFPSIQRVTANWFGEMNRWNLDLYEIFFCAGPFANRGAREYG